MTQYQNYLFNLLLIKTIHMHTMYFYREMFAKISLEIYIFHLGKQHKIYTKISNRYFSSTEEFMLL